MEKLDHLLYVITADGRPEYPVKIGITTDVEKRLRQLQTASPFKLYPVFISEKLTRSEAFAFESRMHREFEPRKMSGEWFNVHPEDAVERAVSYIKRHFYYS